jgi:transposase InsO family protein
MRKLNQKKIRWIIREIEKGERSVYRIAKTQGITPRWAREIYNLHKNTGEYLYPRKPGRKPSPISSDEKHLILETRKKHPLAGAVALEKIMDAQGIHIPHNRIHRMLKEEGLATDEPKKQRRRKWVRYERRYSNSLWHADWFEYQQDKVILFQDDASRFITGYGVFGNATSKNTIQVMDTTVQIYGCPKQIMTDHGTQFTSNPTESCPEPNQNEFQEFLKELGIYHVKSRVKHPQSNGKVERVILTLKQLQDHFNCWNAVVHYYNYERPHSSLENGCLRTPYQAFLDKTRKVKRNKAE